VGVELAPVSGTLLPRLEPGIAGLKVDIWRIYMLLIFCWFRFFFIFVIFFRRIFGKVFLFAHRPISSIN